jgi:hypothetical protein
MRALLLSAALLAALGGCAAIPDVTFTGEGGVDATGDATGDVDGPADATAEPPTPCPARVPNYASACCGEIACSGNDCTTTRCSADCIPACTDAGFASLLRQEERPRGDVHLRERGEEPGLPLTTPRPITRNAHARRRLTQERKALPR